MLAILYTLYTYTMRTIGGYIDLKDREKSKKNNKTRNGFTYIDKYGVERLITNDRPAHIHWENGDQILYAATDKGGVETLRNFSEEKRQAEYDKYYKEAIARGDSVIRVNNQYDFKPSLRWEVVLGNRYKDVKTGETYVIRRIGGNEYYMNMKGELVRLTDEWIKQKKYKDPFARDPNMPDINDRSAMDKWEFERKMDRESMDYYRRLKANPNCNKYELLNCGFCDK